ncbi:MAG: hypothetical protein JNL38_18355 [Myxococcales bacterium]|jgi:hypothetical protein|nr:hypothetical protein [Myxococcales bacterium]
MASRRDEARERAMRAYEVGRAVRAIPLAAALSSLPIVACLAGTGAATAAAVGAAVTAIVWAFGWRGGALGRAIGPGALAGVVPLALALASRSYGHVCTGGECVSLCIPACTTGGLVAGVWVARAARRSSSRGVFLAGASGLALLVGSLGCSCVGYGGVLGLAVGLATTAVPISLLGRRSAA